MARRHVDNRNVRRVAGDTYPVQVRIRDADGRPVDLQALAATGELTVSRRPNDPPEFSVPMTGVTGEAFDYAVFEMTAPEADLPAGKYVGRAVIFANGYTYTVVQFDWRLDPANGTLA